MVSLSRREGHIYEAMNLATTTFFARSQLYKIHRQFSHVSPEKLYTLLKRARPGDTTPETLRTLEELSKRCDPCQRIQNAPNRIHVSFRAENLRFNERLIMDIQYIHKKPILHIVDEATHFSAAPFSRRSTKAIWEKILNFWGLIYNGLPRKILVD